MSVYRDPERRERYAEALYATLEVSPTRHPWETLSPFRRAVWYARADAAMAVADAEQPAVPAGQAPATDQAAVGRVRAVLETEAVVGRSALEYRGLIVSALMADESAPAVAGHADNETLAAALDGLHTLFGRRK